MITDSDRQDKRFEVVIQQMAAKANTLSYLMLLATEGDGEFGCDKEDIRGVAGFLEDMGHELGIIHKALWGNGQDGKDPEAQEEKPRGE